MEPIGTRASFKIIFLTFTCQPGCLLHFHVSILHNLQMRYILTITLLTKSLLQRYIIVVKCKISTSKVSTHCSFSTVHIRGQAQALFAAFIIVDTLIACPCFIDCKTQHTVQKGYFIKHSLIMLNQQFGELQLEILA